MKRFVFACCLIFCSLSTPISYAQYNSEPPKDAAQSSLSKEADVPTETSNDEPQDKKADKNTHPIVPTNNPSLDERMAEIAQKSNDLSKIQTYINGVGLFLLLLTTGFAFGAWRAGKAAVRVAEDTSEKQFRPVLTFKNLRFEEHPISKIIHGDIISYNMGSEEMVRFHIKAFVTVRNWGTTPVYQVVMKALCEDVALVPETKVSGHVFVDPDGYAGFLIPMLAPSEEREVEVHIGVWGIPPKEWKAVLGKSPLPIDYVPIPARALFIAFKGPIYFQDVFTIGKPLDEQRRYDAYYGGFPFKNETTDIAVFPEEVRIEKGQKKSK